MGRIIDRIIKAPLDAVGRAVVHRLNTPMGAAGIGLTAGITTLTVTNRAQRDGVLSLQGGAAVGMSALGGLFLLGAGAAYHKPYLTTTGTATLTGAALGAAAGELLVKTPTIPEVDFSVSLKRD